MLRAMPVVLVLAVLSLAVAGPAQAVIITVNFFGGFGSVTGSFTFDSSIIPSGGGTVGATGGTTDYASSISVTDAYGQVWNSSNSGVNYLAFDSSGNLTDWLLGGDVDGINTDVVGGPAVADFRVYVLGGSRYAEAQSGTTEGVAVAGPGPAAVFWTFSPQPPYGGGTAPEPASWLLLGGALVGLVGVRRRLMK